MLIAMVIAIAMGVPLGILIARHRPRGHWLLGLSSIMQTIPSLALFGFLIPIPFIGGIGKRTVIVALVLYALLPILRNTLVGILGVDAAVCDSAVAMGMTDGQLLRQVQTAAGGADHHGRDPRGHGDHNRHSDHRGGHRRRRAGSVHLSRRRVGGHARRFLPARYRRRLIALLADGGLGWLERKLSPA